MGSDPIGEKPADAESLKSLEFLVVQDIFLTKTAQMADVVLPAATYFESNGTFTNTDRRVQRAHQVIQPVGKICCRLVDSHAHRRSVQSRRRRIVEKTIC